LWGTAYAELELIISIEMRVDLKGRHLSFTEIAKLVGENWQSVPPNEKEPYETQAFNMKEKYNAELAEYKKTENHRKYMEYLNEFKNKQAGVQHGMLF
jgi:HMG (high mobility group) box